jgi:hypothetical protein
MHCNIIYTFPPYLFKVQFHLCLGLHKDLFPSELPIKILPVFLIELLYGCLSCSFKPPQFERPNNICEEYKITKKF